VEKLIGDLVIEEKPVILDLMASWDSHIPSSLRPERVVGLGLNRNELSKNPALTEWCLHDLNKNPILPFSDSTFDVVLNVVSVDYMTKPFDVFREVSRILKPGGLFLVVFSSRMFEQKAVKIWRQSSEEERVLLVEEFFNRSESFTQPQLFASTGKPRPKDDKYAHLGIPSDPIYAVYAQKKGDRSEQRPKPTFVVSHEYPPDPEELQRRKAAAAEMGGASEPVYSMGRGFHVCVLQRRVPLFNSRLGGYETTGQQRNLLSLHVQFVQRPLPIGPSSTSSCLERRNHRLNEEGCAPSRQKHNG
jgi:SAM-dependent methyltransferase